MKPSTSLWPAVALVAVVVAGVIVLSALHISLSTTAALIPVLLAAVGYVINQLEKVKSQTNGNTSALIDQVNKLTTLLAQAQALPPAAVAAAEPPAGPTLDDATPAE